MMKRFWVSVLVIVFTVASFSLAFAVGTADEAKELVEKAAAYVQVNGRDKAVKEFNNPKGLFSKGDLFIFAWDLNGISIANPHNQKQLGMNMMVVPDVDGKFFAKEAVELVKKNGAGWIDYKWKNYTTGKVDLKTSYLKKAGDIIVACGIFK